MNPDGVLRDGFDLKRGFWEAKGPRSDLDKDIARKIATGYPLTNTIFENTKRAVLFQNKKRAHEFNLRNPLEVLDLLNQLAAVETVIGLLIENSFIATFTKRVFGS